MKYIKYLMLLLSTSPIHADICRIGQDACNDMCAKYSGSTANCTTSSDCYCEINGAACTPAGSQASYPPCNESS